MLENPVAMYTLNSIFKCILLGTYLIIITKQLSVRRESSYMTKLSFLNLNM